MNRAFIKLTDTQREALNPLFVAIARRGGALMAQVFQDGIHVLVVPDDVAARVAAVNGVDYLPKIRSALQAFRDGVKRDREGGAAC